MVAAASDLLTAVDPQLETQVTQALREYDSVGFARVRVGSQAGVVTLTGSVVNWYARSLAYQLARRHPHVHRVVDALRVQPQGVAHARSLN